MYATLVPSPEKVNAELSIPSRTAAFADVLVFTLYLPAVIVFVPDADVTLITSPTFRSCDDFVIVSELAVYVAPVTSVA